VCSSKNLQHFGHVAVEREAISNVQNAYRFRCSHIATKHKVKNKVTVNAGRLMKARATPFSINRFPRLRSLQIHPDRNLAFCTTNFGFDNVAFMKLHCN